MTRFWLSPFWVAQQEFKHPKAAMSEQQEIGVALSVLFG